MPKGLELPLNVIVIISISVLILVAIFGIFGTQFFSATSNIESQDLLARGCIKLRADFGCDQTKISLVRVDNQLLSNVCVSNGLSDTAACARSCGCSAEGRGAALQRANEPAPSGAAPQTSQPETLQADVIFERIETVV